MQNLNWGLIDEYKTFQGEDLSGFLKGNKVLLIFLRHLGCTYCRKVVSEFSREFAGGQTEGYRPIFVHMAEPGRGEQFFESYSLKGIPHISDPQKKLYQEFSLKRGSLVEVFGPQVIINGVGDLLKFGVGKLEGDGFQMHGTFLLEDGEIQKSFKPKHVADHIKLEQFITSP